MKASFIFSRWLRAGVALNHNAGAFLVLVCVAAGSPAGLSRAAISKAVILSQRSVLRCLARMLKAGLVARESRRDFSKRAGRGFRRDYYTVTEAGRALLCVKPEP